jgi:hypothetical protein
VPLRDRRSRTLFDRLKHYRFQSVWTVDAQPEQVFAVLSDLASYPQWWPEVKEVHRIDEGHFALRCRSVLPYDLVFESREAVRDEERGILEADMRGDLKGYSRWTLQRSDAGTRAIFDEEVETGKASLNRLALIARPAFRANHSLMMRRGEAGLRVFIAGYELRRRLEEKR